MKPDDGPEDTGRSRSRRPGPRGRRTSVTAPAPGRSLLALTVFLGIVGVILRLVPRGDLWLDEALSVNISSLSMADIPDALRRDGHPPLYYWLLHLWGLAGSSDWWMRALSALIAVIGLPLAYLSGRRLGRRKGAAGLGGRRVGLITMSVWAVLPFAVRYGSETRMYALVSTLVLAGYLLVDNLLGEPERADQPLPRPAANAIGLALVTAALLLTHYWALWLGASVALLTVVVLVRSVSPDRRRRAWTCLGSLGVGFLLFAPWIPTMLYQSEHTGTPWGEVFRPATIIVVTITDLVGGGFGELQVMSYILFSVIAVAVFGALRSRAGREVVELVAAPQSRILPELTVLLGTLVIGWATAFASSSTYASRYAAVIAPLFALCVAAGLAMIRSTRATTALTAVVCAALFVGSVVEITTERTQAGVVADGIATDLVAAGASPVSDGDGQVVVPCVRISSVPQPTAPWRTGGSTPPFWHSPIPRSIPGSSTGWTTRNATRRRTRRPSQNNSWTRSPRTPRSMWWPTPGI